MRDYEKVGKALHIPKQSEEVEGRSEEAKGKLRAAKIAKMRKRRGL